MWLDPNNIPYIALTIAVVALCFTMLNASVGIVNFVLSRFCLLRVREVHTTTSRDGISELHSLEVDLLSYGASIFDLSVVVEIVVRPNAQTTAGGTAGRTRLHLEPIGDLPNPLNAGRGVRFRKLWRPDPSDLQTTRSIERLRAAFVAAGLKDVCIRVTRSEGRVTLKRIRGHHAMQQIDLFLGSPRGIGFTRWQRMIGYFKNRRLEREQRKWGSLPSMNTFDVGRGPMLKGK